MFDQSFNNGDKNEERNKKLNKNPVTKYQP